MTKTSIYYFAYGSNLHPLRLVRRISSAKLIAPSSVIGYQLKFNKKGRDNSSKCNIEFTGSERDVVYGAVYEIDEHDLATLDKIEGLNHGYIHQGLTLKIDGHSSNVITYVAMPAYLDGQDKPFDWYKQLVLSGMAYWKFDKSYVQRYLSIGSKADNNLKRSKQMELFLKEIKSTEQYG